MPSDETKSKEAGLSEILEGLCQAGVEFILVGGLASVIQGAPFTTMDVDIVPRQTSKNINKLLLFLDSADAYYRRMDEKIIRPVKEQLTSRGHVLLLTRFGPLDILGTIEKGRSYKDLIEHTVKIPFRSHNLTVLELETLVEMKRSSEDAKEKLRLPILEETLRQSKKRRQRPSPKNKQKQNPPKTTSGNQKIYK